MIFANGYLWHHDKGFCYGGMEVADDGVIERVFEGNCDASGPVEDLEGQYVLPGLVDIHIHGCNGADCADEGTAVLTMGSYLAQRGVTSFAPTYMTLPLEELEAAFGRASNLSVPFGTGCARVVGLHMEGPFLSAQRKGAQNEAYLQKPDVKAFLDLQSKYYGFIRMVDVAPELEGAVEFARQVQDICTVSCAHTDANYEQAQAFFEAGATHLTHLFNAMPPIYHRKPGVIGAAIDNDSVVAELICDGLHVHPSVVRMAFRLFPERICLISDALRCCGQADGEYDLGHQRVVLKDGEARLTDGTLAGSVTDLFTGMRNAIRFGVPEGEAIRAATLRPAEAIGVGEIVGSLETGRYADFVVCQRDLSLLRVYIDGVLVK